ncbi:MAG: hypothetical protein HY567_04385 [Candidatus Kerfeldbacteria bacterium]|nr:hypothetical protein [Candidatus Kerfeldbacteria bacterium]
MKRPHLILAIALIVGAAGIRVLRDAGLISLPPNVAPIAALALFGGVYLPRRLAFAVPLAAMLLADVLIGFYELGIMASVYGSFAVSGLIGLWLRTHKRVGPILTGTVIGSMVFFLVTNAAVWAFAALYPKTIAGLLAAYVAGLPFFRNTVLGDLAFTGLLFGAFELALLLARRRQLVVHQKS